MGSHKTTKRPSRKRVTRKSKKASHKGGTVCDIICPPEKKDVVETTVEKDDEKKDVVETPVEKVDENTVVETPDEDDDDENTVVETPDADDDDENTVVETPDEDDDQSTVGAGKKGRKAKKSTKKGRKHHKKNRKTMKKKKKSAWNMFVSEFYEKTKKTKPNYMFKNALTDAAKIYNK
tara:strand:- start:4674 stop:5207 length:534 start_codon:yes stop_codon:yes gene_type:complete